MERDYTLERSRIKSELLNKENELSLFEKELNEIQNPETQAKQIEEKLFSHYAQIYKIHPIDRSIENEIIDTIDNKRTNVTKTVREMNDSINHYNGYYPNISTLADLQNNEKKVKKECANELKKIFGELEIDIKRFYKSGIAKDNLEKIIAIMKDICDEISDIATLPVSYQSKVYKWELVAKELPDDEEKENQRKEMSFMEKKKNHCVIADYLLMIYQKKSESSKNQSKMMRQH